jgi:hypothetical protein
MGKTMDVHLFLNFDAPNEEYEGKDWYYLDKEQAEECGRERLTRLFMPEGTNPAKEDLKDLTVEKRFGGN